MNLRKQRRKAWKRFLNQCAWSIYSANPSNKQRELAGQWWNIRNKWKPGIYERTSERKLRRSMQQGDRQNRITTPAVWRVVARMG